MLQGIGGIGTLRSVIPLTTGRVACNLCLQYTVSRSTLGVASRGQSPDRLHSAVIQPDHMGHFPQAPLENTSLRRRDSRGRLPATKPILAETISQAHVGNSLIGNANATHLAG